MVYHWLVRVLTCPSALVVFTSATPPVERRAVIRSYKQRGYRVYAVSDSDTGPNWQTITSPFRLLLCLCFGGVWRSGIALPQCPFVWRLLVRLRFPLSQPGLTSGSLPTESSDANAALEQLHGKRILVVMSWFGETVHGGAENIIYAICEKLTACGAKVEVWSTASASLAGWNQELRNDHGKDFPIRRFATQTWWEPFFHPVHNDGMNVENGTSAWQRLLWTYSNLFGKGMEEALRKDAHKHDVIYLCHYLSGSAHRLSGIAPEKTLLHPFIHDEPPLRSPVMRELFAGTSGVLCNSEAEIQLALDNNVGLPAEFFRVVGNGVELPKVDPLPSYAPVDDLSDRGYVLFIGRLIPEKNLETLVTWHEQLQATLGEKAPYLVLAGSGPLSDTPLLKDRSWIVDLGFISAAEKQYTLSKALCLVQPSLLESFSLVMMEAWLSDVPVIVHADCAATRKHTELSGGGFAVTGSLDYQQAIAAYQDPQKRRLHAQKGRAYVEDNYSWRQVCVNISNSINELLC